MTGAAAIAAVAAIAAAGCSDREERCRSGSLGEETGCAGDDVYTCSRLESGSWDYSIQECNPWPTVPNAGVGMYVELVAACGAPGCREVNGSASCGSDCPACPLEVDDRLTGCLDPQTAGLCVEGLLVGRADCADTVLSLDPLCIGPPPVGDGGGIGPCDGPAWQLADGCAPRCGPAAGGTGCSFDCPDPCDQPDGLHCAGSEWRLCDSGALVARAVCPGGTACVEYDGAFPGCEAP